MNEVRKPPDTSEARMRLLTCLSDETTVLLGAIRLYVRQSGLAQGAEMNGVALEVLQEVAIEALAHADRFMADQRPIAWLLGIAINIIRRRKVERAKRSQRERPLRGLLAFPNSNSLDESEILDQVLPASTAGPEQIVEADEQGYELLALAPQEDREVLRLAFLEGFNRNDIAARLGVTPGAARMRLHRALGHLRAAWQARHEKLEEGGSGDE